MTVQQLGRKVNDLSQTMLTLKEQGFLCNHSVKEFTQTVVREIKVEILAGNSLGILTFQQEEE